MDEMEIRERKSFLTQTEAHLDRNELPAVLDLAEARLKRTPGDLDARLAICRVRLAICRVRFLQGRLDEAGEMLSDMEDILASLSRIYAGIGDICMKEGMKDSAETFYRKVMFLNPGVPLPMGVAERLNDSEELRATDAEEDAEIPSDFETVTLAELYIRQGHLRQAEEVLEKIIGHDPQNGKAAGLLQEVRERLLNGASAQPDTGVIAELSRWLDNIGRLRAHAA
jgi:tetratricopeptide (TPR) repeat protein